MTAKRRPAKPLSTSSSPSLRPPSATTTRQHGPLKLEIHVHPCPACYSILNDLATTQINASEFETRFNAHLKVFDHQLRFT